MRPRPFLLLIAGFALALMAAGDADAGPDDMVAHWSFDEGEGTTAYDSSGNGNDGTLENGPQWDDGVNGSALKFDGVDDYVSTGTTYSDPDVFTVALFFKTVQTYETDLITFCQYKEQLNCNAKHDREIEFNEDGTLTFFIYHGSPGSRITTSNSYNDGTWHQVVVTLSSQGMRLYVDGHQEAEGPSNNAEDASGTWRIGMSPSSPQPHFNGTIDEVTIWDRALSPEEIGELYESYTGPVAHWSFDEGEGTTAYDSSGNGNDGTLQNGPQWVDGISGSALEFDGVDDYVEFGKSSLYATENQLSIAGWINMDTIDEHFYLVSNYNGGLFERGDLLFAYSDTNRLVLMMGQESNVGIDYASNKTGEFVADKWYFVVGTYDKSRQAGEKVQLFINGEQTESVRIDGEHGSGDGNGGEILNNSVNLRIGSGYQSHHADGTIDEVTIWHRALSPEEISELYESARHT